MLALNLVVGVIVAAISQNGRHRIHKITVLAKVMGKKLTMARSFLNESDIAVLSYV